MDDLRYQMVLNPHVQVCKPRLFSSCDAVFFFGPNSRALEDGFIDHRMGLLSGM